MVITRSKIAFVAVKKLCFICNEYREFGSNACIGGGFARCCEEGARRKLLDSMSVFLQDLAIKFQETATRLSMKIGYETHDFVGDDIYYHNFWYIKFALNKNRANSRWDCWITWEWYTCRVFLALKKRIVHEKDRFLLSDLLEDMKRLSELSGLTEPIISNTRTLKEESLMTPQMISLFTRRTSI